MAKRVDNECAYCAEGIEPGKAITGKDWKVYCSSSCAKAGESISTKEWDHLMRNAIPSRDYVVRDQNLKDS